MAKVETAARAMDAVDMQRCKTARTLFKLAMVCANDGNPLQAAKYGREAMDELEKISKVEAE